MKTALTVSRDCRWPRSMLRASAALVLSICCAGVLSAAPADQSGDPQARRFPRTNITAQEWSTYLNEVRRRPGAVEVDRGTIKRIDVASEAAVYFFTRPAHAAYPAAVRRAVVKNANGSYIRTSGYYAGRRDAFLAWLDTFLDQDETLRKYLDRQRKAKPISHTLFDQPALD
ncbi:MAG: hypothetical protein ABI612_15315 [Betaproteobacteria bacterium]